MDLFKLLGTIAIDSSGAKKELDDVSNKGEQSESKLSKAFSTIGKGAAVVGKAVVTGMAVAGTGVIALAKSSISAYADYEQLVGGVETLFAGTKQSYWEFHDALKAEGKSLDEINKKWAETQKGQTTVLKNAANAYKTAGMSSNEYMETVTSFSASLLQSLNNDTVKAAQKADMAITDMSDNANKMGTDMAMIQNAYQGFAKQNYTMLDNLKLGYGGTKEEMGRLLEDAQKISGIEYDISSYADIVDAIHVIQTEMGITGTTAKEASSTIQGSLNMMKASWQNVLIGMADEEADFDSLIKNFVDSIGAFAGNIVPRISVALNGVVDLVSSLGGKLLPMIPSLIQELLPSVIAGATSLLDSLLQIAPNLISTLLGFLPSAIEGLTQLFVGIVESLPMFLDRVIEGLMLALPSLISGLVALTVAICNELPNILEVLVTYLPLVMELVTSALLENLPILIQGLISLVVSLCSYLPTILSALWQTIKQVLSDLWKSITTLASNLTKGLFDKIAGWIRQLFPKSADNILKVLSTIKDAFSTWVKNIGAVLSVVVSVISTPFKLAWNGIKLIWNNVVAYFKMIWENIKAIFSIVDSVLSGDFKGAWEGIKKIWSNVKQFFKTVVDNVKNAFSNVGEIMKAPFEKGKEAIKKIVDNIKGFFTGLKLKFPNIKLPHFKVKGKFSLDPPSVPKLSIDWYKKAMNNPMIMNDPTIFGYNPRTGSFMGGGEAGSEVVSGTNTLLGMIRSAVSGEMGAMAYYLQQLVNMLADYFPQVLELQAAGHVVEMDGKRTAKILAKPMDDELGKIHKDKERGK